MLLIMVQDFFAFQLMVIATLAFLMTGDVARFRWDATRFREWHHFYLGAFIFAVAVILEDRAGQLWHWRVLGASIAADDAFQHFVRTMLREPDYRSPLAWLYAKLLWPLPPVQALNRWLDRVFS